MDYKYVIGGKMYVQRPLVFGQIKQLMPLFAGVVIQRQFDVAVFAKLIGDRLPQFLAIVLTEEGKNPREKNIDECASLFEYEITPEQMVQVVEDFFACNPVASLLEKLTGIVATIKSVTGSKKPSSPSQGEILQNGTRSSGDMHPESANPGLNTEQGK